MFQQAKVEDLIIHGIMAECPEGLCLSNSTGIACALGSREKVGPGETLFWTYLTKLKSTI